MKLNLNLKKSNYSNDDFFVRLSVVTRSFSIRALKLDGWAESEMASKHSKFIFNSY